MQDTNRSINSISKPYQERKHFNIKELDLHTTVASEKWGGLKITDRTTAGTTVQHSKAPSNFLNSRSTSVNIAGMQFPQLVTSLNSNPFQANAQINNSNGYAYPKRDTKFTRTPTGAF